MKPRRYRSHSFIPTFTLSILRLFIGTEDNEALQDFLEQHKPTTDKRKDNTMQEEQVAETIKKEFKVPCVLWKDYYLWNAPYGVYDAELREFRKRVHKRIEELEAQEDEQEG